METKSVDKEALITKLLEFGDVLCNVGFQSHTRFAPTSRDV